MLHQLLHAPRLPRPGEDFEELEADSQKQSLEGSFRTDSRLANGSLDRGLETGGSLGGRTETGAGTDYSSSSRGKPPRSGVQFNLDDEDANYAQDLGFDDMESVAMSSLDIHGSSTTARSERNRRNRRKHLLKPVSR